MVNAMTLATASADGVPSARIVLLKGVDHGFVFFTDYASRKGRELDETRRAALVVYWIELERQVRIEAAVERASERESEEYFATRPLGSRIACGASTQSEVVPDRQTLERRYAEAERRCGGSPTRPKTWGGYRLIPHAIEFWQGRPNRLHDRLLYRRNAEARWEIVRLAP
jgi:pyridoxamine 5'-phosphate oxidase